MRSDPEEAKAKYSARGIGSANAHSRSGGATTSPRIRLALCVGVLALLMAPRCLAQSPDETEPTEGINSGNYNIHQTFEVGYRFRDLSGSEANYDTFVNLGSGARLLNYSVDLRSLNHAGALFDNLSFSNFGYGGDPVDVSRLRMTKNKWYDFRGLFRRDKYFWDYNLFANPLNPASSSPALAITTSPHALDLVRRMSDFNLTLLPESRVQFRLGYSRNIEEGPSLSTIGAATILEPFGTQTQVFQNWKTTQNSYRLGVDFRLLPRTTFHFDQSLQYFKQDTSYADRNFGFQSGSGAPVDLGIVFDTANGSPCASPVANPGTAPPTATDGCSAFTSYSRVARPRTSLPTEQISFQSEFFKNIAMTGSAAYSSGDEISRDLAEIFTGASAFSLNRGSNIAGPSHAKRVATTVNWAATWALTPKFRIVDSFSFDHFQIPGFWNLAETGFFAQAPLVNGGPSLQLPPGVFDATNCPSPFTASTCPQHNSSSGPDIANGTWSRFLAQSYKTNTLQLEYDFTPRFGARLGYRYSNRKVFSQDTLLYSNETFFPGPGPAIAARGDCTRDSSGNLPPGCVLQPDGSIVFSGLVPGADTSHPLDANIHAHSALFGFWTRPLNNLRVSFDLDLFWADNPFVRTDPRKKQQYRFHATYTPSKWVNLDGSVDILEHRNNDPLVQDREHSRFYSVTAQFIPNERFAINVGYTYTDVLLQSLICFSYGFAPPPPGAITTPCPSGIVAQQKGSDIDPFGGLGFYQSTTHFADADVMFKPVKRVIVNLGYSGSFTGGNTLVLNPLAPLGPLRYDYQRPYASFSIGLGKGLIYKTSWSYYGYNPKSPANPPGLAPIGNQDFNTNLVTLALRYTL